MLLPQFAVKNYIQVTIITDERTLTLLNTKAGYCQHNEALRLEEKWSNTLLPHFPGVLLMAIHCCHQLLNEAEKNNNITTYLTNIMATYIKIIDVQ